MPVQQVRPDLDESWERRYGWMLLLVPLIAAAGWLIEEMIMHH
jgi:hypothetical protein